MLKQRKEPKKVTGLNSEGTKTYIDNDKVRTRETFLILTESLYNCR